MKAALATLVLGEQVQDFWRRHCETGWRRYAARHGLDLLVFTEPLDDSPRARARSPAWQKCLVAGRREAADYDRLVWLDADVVVDPGSPCVIDGVPEDRVGAVVSGSYVLDDLKGILMERALGRRDEDRLSLTPWTEYQRVFYLYEGLEPGFDRVIQTGVLVISPGRHRELLAAVYDDTRGEESRGYEQVALSHEILRRDLLTPLNSRFNTLFYERMLVHYPYLLDRGLPAFDELASAAVTTERANSFFLHFAYDPSFADYLSEGPDEGGATTPSAPGSPGSGPATKARAFSL